MNSKVKYAIAALGIIVGLYVLLTSILRYQQQTKALSPENTTASASANKQSPLFEAGEFHNGLAYVKSGSKYGYINKSGKMVIETLYKLAGDFREGLAQVKNDSLFGFIDTTGRLVIPYKYLTVGDFSEGLAMVGTDYSQLGYIDPTGKQVIPLQYTKACAFKNGIAIIEIDGKQGIIDHKAKMIARIKNTDKYSVIFPFSEGLARIIYNPDKSSYGFINTSGKEVIPANYAAAEDFGEGLSGVQNVADDLYGFINKDGKVVIAAEYEDLRGPFAEGLCGAKKNGKWGFIDKQNKVVIDFKYLLTLAFKEGRARFKQNGKWGYLDKSGAEIIPAKYDDNNEFSEGLALVNDNGKWIYIDTTGKVVIERIK